MFPAIHHLHDHHDTQIEDECKECLVVNSNNNYIFDYQGSNIQLCKSNLFEHEKIYIVEFNLKKKYLSRAPPSPIF